MAVFIMLYSWEVVSVSYSKKTTVESAHAVYVPE